MLFISFIHPAPKINFFIDNVFRSDLFYFLIIINYYFFIFSTSLA